MFRKILSCALAIVLTLTITGDLAASARVPSPVTWKSVEIRPATVILVASGKSPKLLRPTFNKVAKPNVWKPKTGRPVSVSQNRGRPIVNKGIPVGRIRGVSLPRGSQRVSVSPAAGRKFTQAVKPAIIAISRRTPTQEQKLQARQRVRQSKLSAGVITTNSKIAYQVYKALRKNSSLTEDQKGSISSTLARVAQGVRHQHRNDGEIFGNREGKLPNKPNGYYKEYVDAPLSSKNPGARRVVTGAKGEVYYTADHYNTFVRIE